METRQQLFRKVCMVLPFCLFILLPLNAQTFTQRLQKQVAGEGRVSLRQDKAIDELVNGPHTETTTVKTTPKKEVTGTKKESAQPRHDDKTAADKLQGGGDETVTVVQTDTMSLKPRKTYRTTGYRVQVFSGGNSSTDRQQAEQTGNQLRMLFPDDQVYVHFYSPRWICRIGNYKTYQEANKMKKDLKELGFGTATIVKGKITLVQQ